MHFKQVTFVLAAVEFSLKIINAFLAVFFVLMVLVLEVRIALMLLFISAFVMLNLAFKRVDGISLVMDLLIVMLERDLNLVDVHSHSGLNLNSGFPLFDHAVFSLVVSVCLTFEGSDSFFKITASLLIEFVESLLVVNGLFHNS